MRLLAAAAAFPLLDPRSPSAPFNRLRGAVEASIGTRAIGLDVRRLNSGGTELFRIQYNAFNYYPLASCFKAFLALYYLWYTARERWENGEGSPLYRVAVLSDNLATGALLAEVAQRVPGRGHALEKFNDFLTFTLFLPIGLYSWNWPGSATAGLFDTRYAATAARAVRIPSGEHRVDNVCAAADLANGYVFLARRDNDVYAHPYFQQVLTAARDLLAIPARNYQSPIERAFAQGYIGKDGILPSDQLATGRVVNDAGLIRVEDGWYVLSLMSAGESESTVLEALRLLADEIARYEGYFVPARFGG